MSRIYRTLVTSQADLWVSPLTLILELKRDVAYLLGVPVEQQKLLLLGRTLKDDKLVQFYPAMKDGARLHLIVKKADDLHAVSIKYFKSLGKSDTEAVDAADRVIKLIEEKFNKLSWDDINKLALDCLISEGISMGIEDNYIF